MGAGLVRDIRFLVKVMKVQVAEGRAVERVPKVQIVHAATKEGVEIGAQSVSPVQKGGLEAGHSSPEPSCQRAQTNTPKLVGRVVIRITQDRDLPLCTGIFQG